MTLRKLLATKSADEVADSLIEADKEAAARLAWALVRKLGPEVLERVGAKLGMVGEDPVNTFFSAFWRGLIK